MEKQTQALWQPMTHPGSVQDDPPIAITSANGVFITDANNQTVLDAVGGLWNVNLGYSCQSIKDAITQQLQDLPYYSSFRGVTTDKTLELSRNLTNWFGEEQMGRAFFTSGGSDSVETALRLARQYHKIRGDKDRYKFIGLKKGYHGTHFGGASINGNVKFRRNYEPYLPGCFHVSCPWTYRNPFNEEKSDRLAQLCAQQLEDEIISQSPDTVAAVIMEPVLGAGGVIVPDSSFMPLVRQICDNHGILLIADEVITAFGRTGAWTGSRLWNVQPDLMCLAKALTNGYFPLGATMISEKLVDTFEANTDGAGEINHGYTYSGHPVGAAAALAVLEELKTNDLATNSSLRGKELAQGLAKLKEAHRWIGDARGIGLMHALELVSDRSAKTALDKSSMALVGQEIYNNDVMVRISGNNMILSPPLIITNQHVKMILDAIDAGLSALTKQHD